MAQQVPGGSGTGGSGTGRQRDPEAAGCEPQQHGPQRQAARPGRPLRRTWQSTAAHGLAPQTGLQRLQVEPSEHHTPTAYPDRVEEPTGRELSGDGPGGVQVGRVEEAARITVLAKRRADQSISRKEASPSRCMPLAM